MTIDRDQNSIDDREDLRRLAERAMRERGFLTRPSEEVKRALEVPPGDDGALRDLTHLPFSSIDNASSRDLDQVEYAEKHNGFLRVMVGIAEVCDFVPLEGAIDRAAMHNATTVYTAGGVFPMLPVALSEHQTSLLDQCVRRAMVTVLDVTPDGSVSRVEHLRAYVRNRCKLTYPAVSPWLEGNAPPPPELANDPVLQEQLKLQDTATQWLRARRTARGGTGFHVPETVLVHDADGHVIDIVTRAQTRAGMLVEDLMIAVNEAVARTLEAHGFSSIRRVVPPPPRWDRLRDVAARWNITLPERPSPRAVADFVTAATRAHPHDAEEIAVSVIKLSGRGSYVHRVAGSDEAQGHFGLATDAYAHTTAPNRRYVDVAIQRLLHAYCAGHGAPLDDETLAAIAAQCTERSALAAKVERQIAKSAAALFLADRIGQRFDAVVTGATEKATWVRLFRPAVEARLVEGTTTLDVGERVSVRLEGVDVAKGHLDFSRARDDAAA